MTFFPFCAIFTLYEHTIACLEPEECDGDIQALENLGLAMAHISSQYPDFAPFVKTINALNRVSRILQDERSLAKTTNVAGRVESSTAESANLPWAGLDAFQNLVASELPDFDPSAFSSIPDFSPDFQGDLYPCGFVRALENDLVGRNWQADWWDLDGYGVTGGTDEMPSRYYSSLCATW